jgi:Restriction endonuclease
MAAYDPTLIKEYLTIVDNPTTYAAKGKAFEDLACYPLNGIPGITITARNEMNTFATEEIDIACKNENDPAGLGALVDFFIVECKGWRDAVNSEQVSWFLTKIRHRGVRFGILIAANGITGEPEHLSRANFLVGVEMATFGIKMVIVTREEIEELTSGEAFAKLIIQKVCILHASGGRCY